MPTIRFGPLLAVLAIPACDLGTVYEGAGPAYYETYIRDPAFKIQREVASLPTTPLADMPIQGTADFSGGFVGAVGGCGFDAGCDHSNRVYGSSWLRADFASGEVTASLSSLVIEYSETDEFGYNTVRSVYSNVSTTTPGSITGNVFEDVKMSSGNYYGNNHFIISGTVDGTFKGSGASAVSANFSGSIASVTGGYPLGGYESLTGQISAEVTP